jgi:glycosyltransferase involved in cell wall biosynthesis
LKILVSAWACNPIQGSESAVGWGWVNALKKYHDIWVMAAAFQKTWIDRAIEEQPNEFEHVRFCYLEPRRFSYESGSRFWKWQAGVPGLEPLFHIYYKRWQLAAYDLARELHKTVHFDLAHQLTFVGFRFPGHLWKLGIPFIWGPIGGMDNVPWRLLPCMGLSGLAQFTCRNIINTLHKRYLRSPKGAFRAARGGIIAATTSIQREIKHYYREDSTVIAEIGLPSPIPVRPSRRNPDEPLRLCWSGLHLARKALPLLLRAAILFPKRLTWTLDVLGSGPCTARWRRLAEQLGIGINCHWLGQLTRVEAIQRMKQSHVCVITSLQDLTSTVLIEALTQGLPVLCPDHCGFIDAIDQSCGFTIPIRTPSQFITGVAKAVECLYDNEDLRRLLAAGALKRARAFSWEQKAAALESIYQGVIERQPKLADADATRIAGSR